MNLPTARSRHRLFLPWLYSHWGAPIAGVLLLLCAAPSVSQNLQDSGLSLPGVWAGQAAWGDYDDDGDLDLALTGEILETGSATRRISRIYRNDSALLVEDVAQSDRLDGVYFGDVAWADYDSDGDLDLAVAGWSENGDESLSLYVNEPGSEEPDRLLTFDLDQGDDLASGGARYAALAWADYDNDGDLDLVVSGMDGSGTSLTRVYANADGVLSLDASNSEAVINVHNGDLAWADYDGDGDLDLALSGENVTSEGGLGPVTEFYRNDPVGTLSLEAELDLGTDSETGFANRVKGGSLAWADYNQDGNPDLAVSGRDAGYNAVLNLFRNRPAGNLSADANLSLSRFERLDGQLGWVDYDNDGDPDLAVAGRNSLSQYRAMVLENRDGAVTGISVEDDLEGLAGGDALWGDYDGNGRVDLLVAGVDAAGERHTLLYSNLGAPVANRLPDAPGTLNPAQVSSRRVIFSWSPGEDVESGTLTYNLRVGTEPGGDDIVSGRVAYGPGGAGLSPDFVLERSLPPDKYYWSVQTVDGAHARSDFSQEELFTVDQFVSSDQRLRSLTTSAMSWGDADGDGDPDLAIMGTNRSGEAQTLVYANQSGTLSLQANAGLAALRNGDLGWGDYDSDGDLDLFVAGEVLPGNRHSYLYTATTASSGLSFETSLRFRPDLSDGKVAWGDADNDGDLDLLLMGQSGEILDGDQLSVTRIYVNDGTGSFDATRDDSLIGLSNGDAAWADYDGDGDLDLAVTGKSTAGVRTSVLYRNDLPGSLVDSGAQLPGLESSDLAWADYDRDGDPDLVLGGIGSDGSLATTLYDNTDGQLQALENVVLPGMQGGDLAWGDVDNDQDVDLIMVGNDGQQAFFRIYENTIGQTAPDSAFEVMSADVLVPVDFSAAALADIDGDGDLDVITSGRDANLAPRTAVNENLTAQQHLPNYRPDAPAALSALDSADAVTLSWSLGSDDGAPPPASLTYDLLLGTQPGSGDIVAGGNALGFGPYAYGAGGGVQTQRITGLASGTYYWAARTVDAGFERSAWSTAASFIIDTEAPQLVSLRLGRESAGIGQAVPLALEFADAHAGIDTEHAPEVTAAVGDSTYDFAQLQFTGTAWSGELAVTESMPSGPVQVRVTGVMDTKGNVLAPSDSADAFRIDSERPAVLTTIPADGETDVSASVDQVVITFSEALDATLAEQVSSYAVRPGGAPQDASLDEASNRVTVDLGEPLQPGVEYTVEVSAALADLVGNRATNSTTWSFRTAVPGLVTTEPADGAADIATGAAALSATFDSGIWRAVLDEGDAVTVQREGADVELGGSPTFDADTGVLSLSLAEPLRAGSRYQVSLSGLLGGPLRATADGDYTWSFSTAVPRLAGVAPDSGAIDVSASLAEARATFTVALDADMVTAENFILQQGGVALPLRAGDPVVRSPGVYGLAPADGWRAGTAYTVQIAAAVTGPLGASQPLTWQFTTAVPSLVASEPADAASGVAAGSTALSATFDSGIWRAVLDEGDAVTVQREGADVELAGSPTFDADTGVLSLSLAEPLRVGSRYQVALSGLLGGPQRATADGDYAWSFSTAIPRLAAVTPDTGAAGVSVDLTEAQATFTVALDADMITTESFALQREGVAVPLRAGDPVVRSPGVYGLAPADGWRAGTAYTVQIAAAVTGPLGPSQPLTWQFTTAVPAVSATEPTDGALGVSVNDATIGIEFSPPPTGVRAALFQMQARPLGAGDDTPFELLSITGFGVTEDGAEVSFAPLGGLQPYTEYRVDIHQAVFGDLAESGYTFGFETAARLADAGDGGTIRGGNGSVELYFPPNALSGGTGEIAITPVAAPAGKPLAGTQSDLTQVGTAYRIDAGAGVLVKPATLSLAYSAEELGALDATRLGIFTYVDQQWQRLGGTPDAAAGKVMTVVEELGTVALFEDLGAAVGSLRIGQVDCQPRAFAPAGTGLRAQTDISFELTDRADVTVRVYGASGRLERIVTQDLPASRGRNAVAWDGRDEDGAIVASGLYVVVVSAGGAQGEKVVAVVR